MQVRLDQEENLDHLDQRCVYLCTRISDIFFTFFLSSSILTVSTHRPLFREMLEDLASTILEPEDQR